MEIKKILESCKWVVLDLLPSSDQAVGVLFPKPKPKDIRKINDFLSGFGVAGPSGCNNDWAWVNIKNLSGLEDKLEKTEKVALSKLVTKATWSLPDIDGNRTGYFKHRKDAICCAEAFKQMQFIPYNKIGFVPQVTQLLPVKKDIYNNEKPNLYAVTVSDQKQNYWFKNAQWDTYGSKKIPSLKNIKDIFSEAKLIPDNLSQSRQDGATERNFEPVGGVQNGGFLIKCKKAVEPEKIVLALQLLTGVLLTVEDDGRIRISKEQMLALDGIVSSGPETKPSLKGFLF